MNRMPVLSVASGDPVHCTFVGNSSLSKHLHTTVVKGSNFALLAPM